MFVLRLVGLMALTAFSYGMATETGPLNAFGDFIANSFFILAPALYLLPTFEAWLRNHPNTGAIALLNVFLGWSLVGWVAALIWAIKNTAPATVYVAPPPMPEGTERRYDPPPRMPDGTGRREDPPRKTKQCPFCAEEILAAAVKCKHCGSDLPSA